MREVVELRTLDVEQLLKRIIYQRPELRPPYAQITIHAQLEPVWGHEADLTHCLTLLLDYAVKHVLIGRETQIHIHSETAGDQVRLCFDDKTITAPAYPSPIAQIRGSADEPARPIDERSPPWHGVNWPILRKVLQPIGGTFDVESVAGRGGRLWIRLPRGR